MSQKEKDATGKTRRSYDAVAREYARHICDELDHRPRERDLLQRFVACCRGWVCDLGCGPGHIAAYLQQFTPEVLGLDLSYGSVAEASTRNAGIVFAQGDMLALPFASDKLAGVLSFYSLIHFNKAQVGRAMAEMHRVLKPGGNMLLGFHVGTEVEHVGELWGIPVDLDAQFFLTDELVDRLTQMGFSVLEKFERDPHPEVEYPSIRGYIWAVKAAAHH